MRAKKIDTNQNDIVKHLRKCGASVHITSMLGGGFPDLVVGVGGKNFLIELKDGDKTESRKRLTPDEVKFFDRWNGQVNKCETLEDIFKIIGF